MSATTQEPRPQHDHNGHDHEGHDHEVHEHDLGLSHDLPVLLNRRRLLSLLGSTGAVAALAACATDESTPAATSDSPGSAQAPAAAPSAVAPSAAAPLNEALPTEEIPTETAGPFPGNGSNGINVLTESGIVRSDLTRSFGSASGVAAGIPLSVRLRVIDLSADGAPLTGAAVYLWHCDRDGRYSLYSDGVTEENYLRGVQAADADGYLTFTTIFPAAYPGRWPHMHFEVYPSLDQATSANSKLRTTQLALPEDVSNAVYATAGYEESISIMRRTSLDNDSVFRDGYSLQMAKVTGSVSAGYAATLTVPV